MPVSAHCEALYAEFMIEASKRIGTGAGAGALAFGLAVRTTGVGGLAIVSLRKAAFGALSRPRASARRSTGYAPK